MSRPRRLDGLTFSKDVWYRITVVYNFCLFNLAVCSYTFRQGEVKEGSVVAWAGHATYGNYLGSVAVYYGTVLVLERLGAALVGCSRVRCLLHVQL